MASCPEFKQKLAKHEEVTATALGKKKKEAYNKRLALLGTQQKKKKKREKSRFAYFLLDYTSTDQTLISGMPRENNPF